MKSGTREVRMSPGMAYWSAIQPELVVGHTGVGMVVTALYGLKQAGLAWWCTLDESLKEFRFECLKSEAGNFFYKKKGTNVVIGIIYVDDALFCGPNKAVVDSIKVQFMHKWECRDLRELNEFF